MLLERLAKPNSNFPVSFNLEMRGNPSDLVHSQWDELEGLVSKLGSDLTNQNLPEHEDRLEWVTKSIELFWRYEPSYIWRDEFEDWYYNRFIASTWIAEEAEDTSLCFNPLLQSKHAEYFKIEHKENINKSQEPKIETVEVDRMERGVVGADWQNDPTLTKLEKQRKAILEIIKLKGFDAMAIPDCEKGTIEEICRADYPLFFDAESSFDNAWKNARHLFKMANHASYAKRGK